VFRFISRNAELCGCSDPNDCYYLSDFSPKVVPNSKELTVRYNDMF